MTASLFVLFNKHPLPAQNSLKAITPAATVNRETHISASKREAENDELHERPEPTAAAAGGSVLGSLLATVLVAVVVFLGLGAGAGLAGGRVEVLGVDADDVVAVAQLARLGAETQVADGGELDVRDLEAAGPLAFVLVHQVHGELLVLEVGDASARGEVCIAHAAGGAAGEFVGFAVVSLVVFGLAVADHGHDVGEDDARAVVLVCVEEDSETLKLIFHAEDRSLLHAGLGDPECHAIAKQSARAVDLEFKFHLPVGCGEGNARVEPAGFGGVLACQADILVGADDGAAAEVEPAGLKIGVEVGLSEVLAVCVECLANPRMPTWAKL